MPTINDIRSKLAKQILFFNSLLILITIIYFFLHGFDIEEFSALITLLTSISAVYLGSLFKFFGKALKEETQKTYDESELPRAAKIVHWIVPANFVIVLLLISAKAFTIITYTEMTLVLGLVESSFGVYAGQIISELFNLS